MLADFHYIGGSGNIRICFYETEGYNAGSIVLTPEKFNAMWELFNYESKEKWA